MADDETSPERPQTANSGPAAGFNRIARMADRFIHVVELLAAWVFAVLFAIGVGDLIRQILRAIRTRNITDPLAIIKFSDTGLLLLIIVEVYHTVIAYTQENEPARSLHLSSTRA